MTPYQYASNDPILNIDIDGLEGGSAVLGYVGDAVVTSASYMAPVIVKSTAKALTSTALKTGIHIGTNLAINGSKAFLNAKDNTFVKHTIKDPNAAPAIKQQSLWNKFSSWLDRMSHGSGSYQDYGITFTGNDNGTMEFRDHAGTILDHINIGPLFGALKATGLDGNVFRNLLSSPDGLKYVANLFEASKTVFEVPETVKEAVILTRETFKKPKVSLQNNNSSKGDSMYVDDYKYKVNSDGDTIETNWRLKLVPKPKN